jgi:hypothetical protein
MARCAVLLSLAVFLGSAGLAPCQSNLPVESGRILQDYAFVRSLYPRLEGSAGEQRLMQYIRQRLDELKVSYQVLDFRESDSDHSFSTSLVASIPGERPDTLLLALPVNHPAGAPADLDGSANVALGLAAVEQLSRTPPPLSVQVLFLGAEFGEEAAYPMGSRLFLRDFYPDHRVMCLYLNLKRLPSRLHVRSGGRGIECPYWLIDRTTRALRATDIFFLVRGNENQIFRVGLTSERTVIEPYLLAGYPAIALEGEYGPLTPLEEEKWVASFGLFLKEFLQGFLDGIPETWDRHYLFFQARGFYFSVSETTYVAILLFVLAGTLLYGLIFTRRLRRYLRSLVHHLWALPLFAAFIFILLYLSTWILEGVLYARRITDLWEHLPLAFLAFKLALPIAFLFVLMNLVRRLPVPRRGSFYSAAALLFLLLDIVVLAVVNIAFTYYFLWAFVFALLFSMTANRLLKVLFFLASPYWIVKTVVELFTLPRLEFCRLLLLSRLPGNLLIAVVLLPFVLMFIRLKLIFPPLHVLSDRLRRALTSGAFAALLGGLLTLFFVYSPYGNGRSQPISASYLIDEGSGAGSLSLSSPAPLGSLTVRSRLGEVSFTSPSRSYTLPLESAQRLLETTFNSVSFLDRKNISIGLTPWGQPHRIRLRLSAPEEFVLFDANFPYAREPGGREYSILVGANPPVPLTIQLTVPRDRSYNLEITLEYLQAPDSYQVVGRDKAVSSRLTYRRSLALKT